MSDVESIIEELLSEAYKMLELSEAWGDSSPREDKVKKGGTELRKTVHMSPDDYIKKAVRTTSPHIKANKKTLKNTVADRESDKESMAYQKKTISSKETEAKRPYLDYSKNSAGQEGIHRALAAKKLGHKTIPVDIYTATSKGGNVSRDDKVKLRKQIKADKEEARRKEEERKRDDEARRKDREAHPEKYKHDSYIDLSHILGPGW